MDNVTHALAGLLLGEATVAVVERRTRAPAAPGFRRAALLVGLVAAELPDADLAYSGWLGGGGKLGYLLHHRGHTHTVVAAVLGALLVWGVALLLRKAARAAPERGALLALALVGTLGAHLALDGTNNYGVHAWWPLSNAWGYGDSIFIIEPWLWVASLPPLLVLARSHPARAGYALALALIVAAAWRVAMVERGVALALTLAVPAMLALAWLARRRHGTVLLLAVGAWGLVETTFAVARSAAHAQVTRAVAPGGALALAEVTLTPAVGNPLCFRALTVELDGPTYHANEATVAPWPALRRAAACPDPSRLPATWFPAPHAGTRAVRWGRGFAAPRAELARLTSNCVVAASLRFMRVPAWTRRADGSIVISDLRFGAGEGGFADIVAPAAPRDCPRFVPPWTPPREDVLTGH